MNPRRARVRTADMDPRDIIRERTEVADRGYTSPCWIWAYGKTEDGYGGLYWRGYNYRVHRLAYEHFVGPIPDGLHIDHLCRQRDCCNPSHLEPVIPAENTRRGRAVVHASWISGPGAEEAPKCMRGHPLIPTNLVRAGNRLRCRTCRTLFWRRHEIARVNEKRALERAVRSTSL